MEIPGINYPNQLTVHERSEKEHAGRVEWVKTSVRSDLRQEDSSKSGRQDLQDGWYTCYDVWFDDGGAVQNTRGQAGDAKNDQNGQSSK